MSIASAEITLYYAKQRDQTTPDSNGGRPSDNAVTSNVEGNIWPSVTSSQRETGQTRCEKVFFKNRNAADDKGLDAWIALSLPNPSDEFEWIVPADQDDLQSDLAGTERKYSAGLLAADAAVGASTIRITLDNSSLADAWKDGDAIIIYSNQSSPAATTGIKETNTISGAPTLSGSVLTITLATPLINAHTVANGGCCCGKVASAFDFAPRVDGVLQSGTGSYDITTYPIELGNLGTIRQKWTLTYLGSGLAELSGDTLGSLGSFSLKSDIAPINAVSGTAYLTIKAGGHGAAHVNGDTLVFDTYEAAMGVFWFKQTPAGAAAMGLTVPSLSCGCETTV